MKPHLQPLSVATILLAMSGCGPRTPIVPFAGKVLYKGQPLEFGSVMLQPIDGGQPAAGIIQRDGTFVMNTRGAGDGATVGRNRVRITCFPAQDPGRQANTNQELALGRSLIPTKYNSFGTSELIVEVKPNHNETCVIELDNK